MSLEYSLSRPKTVLSAYLVWGFKLLFLGSACVSCVFACVLSPTLPSSVSLALAIALVRFSGKDVVMQNLMHFEDEPQAGAGTPLDQVRREVQDLLYADGAGVVPRPAHGQARMVTVIVEVFGSSG